MSVKNYVCRLLRIIAASPLLPNRLRSSFFGWTGVRVGSRCLFMPGLSIPREGNVQIGNDVYINYFCYLDSSADIHIGDHVHLADHVRLLTSTHRIGGPDRRAGEIVLAPLRIEDGCWLGSGVTVFPGVTLGRGCIVAAGAVVTRNCEPDGIYAGVPAKRIRELVTTSDHRGSGL